MSALTLPDVVVSDRLRLPIVTLEDARAFREGQRDPSWHPDYPRSDDLDAATLVREGSTWGPRHVVRAFDGLVVGSAGFYGPPEVAPDGVPEAELGYGLVAEAHGHGVASEAVRALLVHTDEAGCRVRASVAPENRASVRVLAKCGFTELRGSNEDGELVMARPLPGRDLRHA